jgi:hypothetical protein
VRWAAYGQTSIKRPPSINHYLPLYYFHVFVGTLKGRDVLRIVNNYNLIYNLHFPEDRVLEIAQQCTVPNTHEVVIDEFVKVLWELMKTV